MTTRFNNAVSALVQAFFTDTLAKGHCSACAVGNMVACGFGEKKKDICDVVCKGGAENWEWSKAFYTTNGGVSNIDEDNFDDKAVTTCVLATGYNIQELIKVEYAFEVSTKIDHEDYWRHSKSQIMQDQYTGLMAVLDILCEIEGIEDSGEYKQMFSFSETI